MVEERSSVKKKSHTGSTDFKFLNPEHDLQRSGTGNNVSGTIGGGSNLRRSLSSAAVSGEKSGLDLDDDTMEELSLTNSMIKAMFESSAPKYRYGGAAGSAENLACNSGSSSRPKSVVGGPVMRPSVRAREERKWVVDTVNKYFDVIVEDEEGDSEPSSDEASFHETDEEEEESPYNSEPSSDEASFH